MTETRKRTLAEIEALRIELLEEERRLRCERAHAMQQLYVAGKTLQEIGDLYGISRERVRQLIPLEPVRRHMARLEQREYETQARRLFKGISRAVKAGHGTINGCQYLGCKCERCRAAVAGRMRDYLHARKPLQRIYVNTILVRTAFKVCWCPYCDSQSFDHVHENTADPHVKCDLCGAFSLNPRYIKETE